MKRIFLGILLLVIISLPWFSLNAGSEQREESQPTADRPAVSPPNVSQSYPLMPPPGRRIMTRYGYSFVYNFDKTPEVGTLVLKVEVYNKTRKRDTLLEIKADTILHSTEGAQETGERPLKLSKNGDYLLPIDITKPGDWEIRLTFSRGGRVMFKGSHQFGV